MKRWGTGLQVSFALSILSLRVLFFYNIFIRLYALAIAIASLWNNKAAQWKKGRQNLWQALEQTFSKPHALVWIHAASAGEFEQAKPVIEALKKQYPQHKILVSFFSPSGYPAGKKFKVADYVFYLPLDTKENAERFIDITKPQLVIFIKYDFWYHYLKTVHDKKIPLLLVSAIFRKEQTFFKAHGAFYKSMLHFFTQLFVQDEASATLLKEHEIAHVTVAGDTRFDRVLRIANAAEAVPLIEQFTEGRPTLIAGSTWPADEALLHGVLKKFDSLNIIIAPHEVNAAHITQLKKLFQNPMLFSQLLNGANAGGARVLVIDSMGLLSRIYRYATITYIGGGFGRGIHNTLEAAVWGKPVLFGPNYQKFREARQLIESGAAFSINNETELIEKMGQLLSDAKLLEHSSIAAGNYIKANAGATQKIMDYIQEKRLLTNL